MITRTGNYVSRASRKNF